jgi:TPR repeat protein
LNLLWKLLTGLKWANRARTLTRQRAIIRAEQGDPDAQYDLAERYHDGLGVSQNHQQAFLWFQRAAQQGHARAQTNLGLLLFLGRGTPPNPVDAVKWLTLAVRHGDPKAEAILNKLRSRLTREQFEQGQALAKLQPPPAPGAIDVAAS